MKHSKETDAVPNPIEATRSARVSPAEPGVPGDRGVAALGGAPRDRSLRFVVIGPPKPWDRARRQGKRYFTDRDQTAYRERIALLFRAAAFGARWHLDGRYAVTIDAHFAGEKTADVDNLGKQVLDALNSIAWVDDRQVTRLLVERHQQSAEPRLEVTVSELSRTGSLDVRDTRP